MRLRLWGLPCRQSCKIAASIGWVRARFLSFRGKGCLGRVRGSAESFSSLRHSCSSWPENVSEVRDRRFNPIEGQLVDVGGPKMPIHCTGDGSPTVMLDSGLARIATSSSERDKRHLSHQLAHAGARLPFSFKPRTRDCSTSSVDGFPESRASCETC